MQKKKRRTVNFRRTPEPVPAQKFDGDELKTCEHFGSLRRSLSLRSSLLLAVACVPSLSSLKLLFATLLAAKLSFRVINKIMQFFSGEFWRVGEKVASQC